MAYRNVFYDNKNEVIHLFTWDKDGNRTKVLCSYEPYLYIESQNGCDGRSIFNSTLKKITFSNQKARNKFVQETPITRLFYNLGTDQQFLLDNFKNDVNKPDYGKQPLKIFYIDIETYSDGTGFSKACDANDPINLITIFDSLSEKYYTFGCKNYATQQENVKYIKCLSEKDLLTQFLRFWKKDYPDIVTGWNIDGYDIPYIINRINKVWGNDAKANDLSPVGRIQFREKVAVNKLGQAVDRWYIHGISILDYMEVYKTFAQGNRESYSLNYIGEYELGEGKIAVGSYSLSRLADEDWMRFVDYNIQDVRILIKLEETLKYLKLIRNLSYRGFVPFTKALAKVSVITGAVAHQALQDNYIIPTFNDERTKKKFAGGYVYEPVPGLYEDLVTYDANSLYPNTIITLNISPETKIGKIISREDNKVEVLFTNQQTMAFSEEKFQKFIIDQQLSVTKANILYTQKTKGIVPKLIDKLYTERIAAKGKMLDAEKKLKKSKDENEKRILESEVIDNYTLQNVYKTLLNSIYGVFSNIYSPLFDIQHAESVTLTGQAVVKTGAKIVHDYAKSKGFEGELNDICVYSDTDSIYFSFSKLFAKNNIILSKDNEITPEASEMIKEIGEVLNTEINNWAKRELNTVDPRYFFKREKICDAALLQAKKYYILHILDSEGIPTDEFLYKGIEIATSKISKEIKEMLKKVVESAIISKDRKKAVSLFQQSYEDFCKLPVDAISTRKKVNNYKKYEDMVTVKPSDSKDLFFLFDEDQQEEQESSITVGKKTPGHTKAAIHFNTLLEKLNITNKYHSIQTGSTIKVFYCEKNKFNYDVFAYNDELPLEVQEYIKPDYKIMFEKNFMPVVTRIFEIIGWPTPEIGCEEYNDLISLFS
jgi:DNA polymerase elongation subunit (family B)